MRVAPGPNPKHFTPRKFASKCHFYERDGQMHGRCILQLRNGSHVTIETHPGQGVPMGVLTHALAMQQAEGNVGGIFGNVWKAAKKTAGAVATGKLAKDLLHEASKVAMSDLGAAALSFVPGGTATLTAVKLGVQAADMLGKAVQGDPVARQKIVKVKVLAQAGHPQAIQAHRILKAVHAKGKAKGVFPSVKPVVKATPKAKVIVRKVKLPRRVAPGRMARPMPIPYAPEAARGYGRQGIYWAGLRGALAQWKRSVMYPAY
jgi:hypothetical protein